MKELTRYEKYTREEVHDIFSPNTNFTPHAGVWGLQGIIPISYTHSDYIFFVTYGHTESGHEFDESIDENGILTWQSQPSQSFNDYRIKDFINHDENINNIYLFLRTNGRNKHYTYLGLLAYASHDNQRENPVYFKWQILDWNEEKGKKSLDNLEIVKSEDFNANSVLDKKFDLTLKQQIRDSKVGRTGKSTQEFYSNRNVDFEGEMKKNTALGNKGEDLVVDHEKKDLIHNGRPDLAEKVVATRILKGNAERFDVLSFEIDGKEKYIEVKTTKGSLNNRFHISENEVSFSEKYSEKYYLYIVYNLNIKNLTADLYIQKGAIDRSLLQPTNYVC